MHTQSVTNTHVGIKGISGEGHSVVVGRVLVAVSGLRLALNFWSFVCKARLMRSDSHHVPMLQAWAIRLQVCLSA